jgi:capsular polysaccharide biosynthesis protein
MAENQQFDFNSSNFIVFLYKWRKPIVVVGLAAILISVLFSSPWFITPKYKSTVILFPTSTNAISKALLTDNFGNKQDILEFGEEEQAEQLLQVLNSNTIRSKVIGKFGLMAHYEIDSTDRYKNTKLYGEYDENITFSRTEYMAVQISVLDKDPQMAADIANNIADLVDSVKNQMIKERAIKAFKIVADEYHNLEREVKLMEDSMTVLRKLGVHEYETQSEMIMQQLAMEYAKNNVRGIKALEDKLAVLAQYGGAYVSLREALLHEKKQLSMLKAKFAEAKVDAEQVLPQKFIVNSAFKAEKRSYPVRWLIVLITTLSSVLLCILVLITIESIDKRKIGLVLPEIKKKD